MAAGYRADIDGLRAIAVLPVLFYHAGVAGFGGGYVGVDIFFVISGYLITGILAREIDAGQFSILNFYERRARRIMPALMAMIAVVLAAAAFLYLPGDFEAVPRSAIAATAFLSNVFFFLDVGYFMGGAETKPLLHTWSLAVEEQFYIGFPILLMLVARFAARWRTAIVAGIALISFAWALATQAGQSGFAFYLLPPRAWELFVGALLALGAVPVVENRVAREALAAAGLAAIAFAVVTLDRLSVFPGMNALYPVLGAAALIHAAPGTWTGRLLAWRPLTAIGLISYSLYLVHWPLIVFTEYARDETLTGGASAAVVALSIGLAALSWRFIERPFRQRARFGRGAIFAGTGAAMAAVCAVSLAMIGAGGWPQRFSPEVLRLAAAKNDVSPFRNNCHDSGTDRAPCVLGAKVKPEAVFWGDSHGVELAAAVSEIAAKKGEALVQRTQSSCPPVLGYDPPADPRCARVNAQVFAAIKADPAIRTVYLAGFWASDAYGSPGFARELDGTIAALVREGRQVVLFGAVPPNGFAVPRKLAHLARAGRLDDARGRDRVASRWLAPVLARWRARGVTVIDPADTLCGPTVCDIVRDGHPLYFDSHHLSMTAARLVAAPLAR